MSSRTSVIGVIIVGGSNDLNTGILGEGGASKVTGGVGVVDSENRGVRGESGDVGEGEAIEGIAALTRQYPEEDMIGI